MSQSKIPCILQALLFLIPLNIYIIGDWMGSGIQTLFFRYMQTYIGNSLIFLHREMSFVFDGVISGKSALASVIWCVGVALICIATVAIIFAYIREDALYQKYCAFLNLGGAILFTLSVFIQYGITLNGPAGIAIPLGIPVILGVAYMQYKWEPAAEENDIDDDRNIEDDEMLDTT